MREETTWDNLTNGQPMHEFFRNSNPDQLVVDCIKEYAEWCEGEWGVDSAHAHRVLHEEVRHVLGRAYHDLTNAEAAKIARENR